MANICSNEFYAYTEDRANIKAIEDFIDTLQYSYCSVEDCSIDAAFDSNWVFPIDEMINLFNTIPNKEDIYMRCLSVEYGTMYHSLWECNKEGWREV